MARARPSPGTVLPFERLVTDHGATVLRVCRAVLGPSDADDAWSETFLAALRAYPDAGVVDHEAWLVTIAHRRAVDLARARARRPVPVAEMRDAATDERPDETGAAWEALRDLSQRQRAAVVYHHVAGLPYRRVAEILGGSEDAARRAAADGIAALRASLTTTSEEDG